nr:VanW family protein [Kineococcus aurantiacus]
MAVRPVDGRVALVADGEGLQAAVTAADPQFETAPQDARIEIVGDRPQVVPAVAGRAVPAADLATAVTGALTGAAPSRRAEVALAESQPGLTTEELSSLGIVERISTFATKLTPDAQRTDNIRIAARYVDGTILRPGEEFSLNDTVGERTPERGFHKAPVISGGRLVDDYGGGVSQLSTTLFNNVFFAGLDEIEHKPHSLYISRYPEGREATLDWRSIDNRFRNDSGHGVYVQAGIVGNQVVVSMYGTKFRDVESITSPRRNVRTGRTVYDTSAGCTPNSTPHTGFTVDVTRVMTPVGGGPEERETWTTVYNSDNRVVCGPDPSTPKPAPTPTAPATASAPPATPAQ